MKLDHIILDIEIKKCIGEDGLTWDDTDKLGVACAVVYEYATERFRIYGDSDLELNELQGRIGLADRVTTYNGLVFDLPVIYGQPRNAFTDTSSLHCLHFSTKSDDLLRRIWHGADLDLDKFTGAHKGYGLDVIARATLGRGGKIGHGLDAPRWYQAGRFGKLHNYCLNDVALTKELCEFIDRHGYILKPITMNLHRKIIVAPWATMDSPEGMMPERCA